MLTNAFNTIQDVNIAISCKAEAAATAAGVNNLFWDAFAFFASVFLQPSGQMFSNETAFDLAKRGRSGRERARVKENNKRSLSRHTREAEGVA